MWELHVCVANTWQYSSLCSSPKGKLWISHNSQLQHNNNCCPFIFCDNWNTDSEQQDNGVVSTCRRISECLQIWVILVGYGTLNLWHYKTFSVVWFSLFLSCFTPSFQMVWKECIQCSEKKRGSQDCGEWSDFPRLLIWFINSYSLPYIHTNSNLNIKSPTCVTDDKNVVKMQQEKSLWD